MDRFNEQLNQVELTEEYSINFLLNALKPEIEVQVRMLASRTLMNAYSLAKLAEQSLMLQRAQWSYGHKQSKPLLPTLNSWVQGSRSRGQGMNTNPKHSTFSSNSTFKGSTRLTGSEMDDKRAKGLYFWCDEKFVVGHNCRKEKNLFIF